MAKKVVEEINNDTVNQVCEGVSKTNGGLIAKLAVGALGVAATIGAVIFYKNKKNNNEVVTDDVEVVPTDNEKIEK